MSTDCMKSFSLGGQLALAKLNFNQQTYIFINELEFTSR
jgi:hypothetical protein